MACCVKKHNKKRKMEDIMNSAKKVMKNQGTVDKKGDKKSGSNSKMKMLIIGGVLLCVLFVAAVCYEQFRPRVIATVGDQKIYLTDAMYDIYSTEAQYNSMSSLYQQIYGSDYWSTEVDEEGTTGAQQAKNDVLSAVEQRAVLCQEAANNNVVLTAEEKTAVAKQVTSAMENMTTKQKGMLGLSKGKITKVLEAQALADKYKKQLVDGYDIDDAAIKAKVSKKDNRQYDLQYYYVSTQTTDANNKTVAKSDAEKATLKQQMDELATKSATAKDFTKLLADGDKSGIEYQSKELVETDTDFLTKALLKQVKKMNNGEISTVLEGEDGYYLIKMENNNDSAAYDKACEDAVQKEEDSRFETDYQTLAATYGTEVNESQWNKIKLGNYTTK